MTSVKMNKRSCLATLTLMASAAVSAQAQEICSCSPTIFNFSLEFRNIDCGLNTVADNPGIQTAMCFQELVDAVPGELASEDSSARNLQATDAVVEVVSVQFLEFGTEGDLTVIYQDNTYATTSLMDGDALQFTSISSTLNTSIPLQDQTETSIVPGGASLILYGKTESGAVLRNRFFWLYEINNCGRENNPIQVGDQIGWVKVTSLGSAWPAFCPALPDGSPTISPQESIATTTPSASPTETLPTTIPPVTTNLPTDGTQSLSLQLIFGGKSAKSKTKKKSGKSKTGKSKSVKSTQGSSLRYLR